jgi:hypothetical protein
MGKDEKMLVSFLFEMNDHRRKQGIRYQQGHILLFAILGILSGATSYRKVHQFIEAHYDELNKLFVLNWKRMPAYTTIRDIIQKTSGAELEACFRKHRASLGAGDSHPVWMGCDGKVLRGSFDHFKDQKAVQILSIFASEEHLILAHQEITSKSNEIPAAQHLIQELGLRGRVFTMDAIHCQKNTGSG